eukprot:6185384-Pleurochrysis_carterae.AAC.1
MLHSCSSSLDSPVDAGSQRFAWQFSRTSQSDHLLIVMEGRKNHQSFSQLATRAPDSTRILLSL